MKKERIGRGNNRESGKDISAHILVERRSPMNANTQIDKTYDDSHAYTFTR